MNALRCASCTLFVASALATAGCAGATLRQSDEPTVELVAHNESTSSVTAFVHEPLALPLLDPDPALAERAHVRVHRHALVRRVHAGPHHALDL